MTLPLWKKLNDAINSVVDNVTLADLIDDYNSRHDYII
jgi:DNA-binding IscR family transcriptional regulator